MVSNWMMGTRENSLPKNNWNLRIIVNRTRDHTCVWRSSKRGFLERHIRSFLLLGIHFWEVFFYSLPLTLAISFITTFTRFTTTTKRIKGVRRNLQRKRRPLLTNMFSLRSLSWWEKHNRLIECHFYGENKRFGWIGGSIYTLFKMGHNLRRYT